MFPADCCWQRVAGLCPDPALVRLVKNGNAPVPAT